MRTTIGVKVNCSVVHRIDEYCTKKGVNRSVWLKRALKNQLVKDKILDKPEKTRVIKSKIKDK